MNIPPASLPVLEKGRSIVRKLRKEGFTAYFAGGCVRDMLLERPFKDIDIASDATPDEVEALFDHTHAIGKAFGVIQVLIDGDPFEVATFRQDLEYTDGRRPDGIRPSSPEEDAQRRDFTINGLFWDPLSEEVLDYVGGQEDLENRIIKAIGDPQIRFQEDHLRLMRAVRFASVLGFDLEAATLSSITTHAHLLPRVSPERICSELVRILTEAAHPGKALALLADTGLLEQILPEALKLKGCEQPPEYHPEGDVWTHTCLMLDGMDSPSPELALAVLLHDIGKPGTRTEEQGRIRFQGHAQVGAAFADQWLRTMRVSNAMRKTVVGAVDRHMNFMNVPHMKKAGLRRMVAHPDFPTELDLHRLDCRYSNGITVSADILEAAYAEFQKEKCLPDPWITGTDLLAMGMSPGPEIGLWKTKAYEAQLEGLHPDRDSLLNWVRLELGHS